jgi:hypothetical protein
LAFTLQNQAKPGLGLYHGLATRSLCLMKIPLALQPHNLASFCLIFAGSLSADGSCKDMIYHFSSPKECKGLQENRVGSMACGQKVFSCLIFWLLLDQAKSNSLSGN